jgi:hypothetical protein
VSQRRRGIKAKANRFIILVENEEHEEREEEEPPKVELRYLPEARTRQQLALSSSFVITSKYSSGKPLSLFCSYFVFVRICFFRSSRIQGSSENSKVGFVIATKKDFRKHENISNRRSFSHRRRKPSSVTVAGVPSLIGEDDRP